MTRVCNLAVLPPNGSAKAPATFHPALSRIPVNYLTFSNPSVEIRLFNFSWAPPPKDAVLENISIYICTMKIKIFIFSSWRFQNVAFKVIFHFVMKNRLKIQHRDNTMINISTKTTILRWSTNALPSFRSDM